MAEVRFKGRILLITAAVMLVFIFISIRLAKLHLMPDEWVRVPIEKERVMRWKPVGSRGRIVDRNGAILAMDRPAYHLYIDPKYIAAHGDAAAVQKYLSKAFGLAENELEKKLSKTRRQCVYLKKYLPDSRVKDFKRRALGVQFSIKDEFNGSETNIYLKGVMFEEVSIRNYPKGSLMAHVIGFANREGVGGAGIEQRMDRYLKGKEGLRVSKKDGRKHEIYSTREIDIPPVDGANVHLTLDQQLQYKVEQAVEKMCHDFQAKAGWAIIQNVRTGEILAMTSYPTYDLNRYGRAPAEWRRNRAISINYEPGSTMKAAVISAAIDHDIVKETDIIDCENGYWVYCGIPLRDSHGEGKIPVADVVKVSSNIGTAKIALKMGNQLLYDSVKAFQFGNRLGVGLPGEEGGIFYSPKHWSKISATRIGMGHEIAATALQVLSMMSTIAYNGVQMKPMLVSKVVAADGTVLEEFKPKELGRPISPSVARRMQQMLVRVVGDEDGTAEKAAVEDFAVAGKTGTAQKIRPIEEGGGYYQKNFTSSFAGFLPADNPQISIVVVADDPGIYTESGRKTKYFGGTVCAPVFSEIAEFAVRYLRISPEGNRVYLERQVAQ